MCRSPSPAEPVASRPHGRSAARVSALRVSVTGADRRHRPRATGRGFGQAERPSVAPGRQAVLGDSPLRDERRSAGASLRTSAKGIARPSSRTGRGLIEPDGPEGRRFGRCAPQRQIRFPPLRGGPSAFAVAPVLPTRPVLAVRPAAGDEQAMPPTGLSVMKNKEGLTAHCVFVCELIFDQFACASQLQESKQAELDK